MPPPPARLTLSRKNKARKEHGRPAHSSGLQPIRASQEPEHIPKRAKHATREPAAALSQVAATTHVRDASPPPTRFWTGSPRSPRSPRASWVAHSPATSKRQPRTPPHNPSASPGLAKPPPEPASIDATRRIEATFWFLLDDYNHRHQKPLAHTPNTV
ncbi:uncharacterized protein MONBRDRAFT_8576 [Monosiga brevicollis MX1]|uniref:Uncharacterized protein n=1 Tax=Monosiga brevicollis TaxID=81824 RepID=A9V0G2_MONBE|nr:uncharacterized protein MONBRDRAFT_8576 [Monosiga brevicollis MX1]EDQ89006.1 predicted protein [Monosiga brevicollis MX1]|eukprot:XP_001746111.1 hypothetical protein [Monosiga brevicollis MX1]